MAGLHCCCIFLLLLAQDVSSSYETVLQIHDERDVPSLTDGTIVMSELVEGKLVRAGQTIAQIDDRKASKELEKLRQELNIATKESNAIVDIDYAEQSRKVAIAELNRARSTNARLPGTVSQSELDQLRLVVDRSTAELKKAKFQQLMKKELVHVRQIEVDLGEQRLENHRLVSPINGIVVEIFKKPGEWVEESEVVARIIQLDRLFAEIKIPATQNINSLKERQAFFVPKASDAQRYPAKTYFVHPEANPINSTVRVWLEVENIDRELIAGIAGKIEFSEENPEGKNEHVVNTPK